MSDFRSQVSKWDNHRNPHGEGGEQGEACLWAIGSVVRPVLPEGWRKKPPEPGLPIRVNWLNLVAPMLQMVGRAYWHLNSPDWEFPSAINSLRKTKIAKCRNKSFLHCFHPMPKPVTVERVCDALLRSNLFFSCETETGTFSPIEEKVSWYRKEACSTRQKPKGAFFYCGELKKMYILICPQRKYTYFFMLRKASLSIFFTAFFQ